MQVRLACPPGRGRALNAIRSSSSRCYYDRNDLARSSVVKPRRTQVAAGRLVWRGATMSESLRDIRIFVAVYEERSFTAAAIREHATQSGVSQHIRKLEEGFRVKLFNREKGRVAPTPTADASY